MNDLESKLVSICEQLASHIFESAMRDGSGLSAKEVGLLSVADDVMREAGVPVERLASRSMKARLAEEVERIKAAIEKLN